MKTTVHFPLFSGFHLTEIRTTDHKSYIHHFKEKEIFNQTAAIPFPYTESDAKWWTTHVQSLTEKHEKPITFAIRDSSGQLIGGAGLQDFDLHSHWTEIGYWLAKPFWRQGIISQAVAKLIRFGFEDCGLSRLTAQVLDFNIGSEKVLLKNGFQQEGLLRKHYLKNEKFYDAKMFGLLKEEWVRS